MSFKKVFPKTSLLTVDVLKTEDFFVYGGYVSDGKLIPTVNTTIRRQQLNGKVSAAWYSELLKEYVLVSDNRVYHAPDTLNLSQYTNLAASQPSMVETHSNSKNEIYIIGDSNYLSISSTDTVHTFKGGVHSCILKNGRIFGIDNSNPNKIKWSGEGGIDDWTEGISGAGWTIVQYGYGEILNLVVYKDKIVAVREYGLTLFSAYGTPENYKLSYIDRKLPKILKNTAAVVGDRLIFYTEDGLYFYDGAKCEKCNLRLADDIRTPTCATVAKDKYYLCGLSKWIGRRAILVYDLNLNTVYVINVDASVVCVGDKMVGYSTYNEYEFVTGGQYCFESAEIDFGTKRQKVLKEVIIEGATGLELEITSGDSVNYVNSVRGKYRPNMRGTSFQITVYGRGKIDRFCAVAEVVDEI